MLNLSDVVEMCRVASGKKLKLKDLPTSWEGGTDEATSNLHHEARRLLTEDVHQLGSTQELLYAANSWSVLMVLQAMDAAGKDGTIEHVMTGVNPQGVKVVSFKQPSTEELSHDFLWRCSKALPARGEIGIFNRSYYEEVLVVKVHPELLAKQRIPGANPAKKSFWKGRYKSINQFERHLVRNGTQVIKFFLHVSKPEQKRRLLDRINDPKKNWKFSAGDVAERALWNQYMSAYDEMLSATSTKFAPWFVIPADDKPTARLLVAQILSNSIQKLGLKSPVLTPSQHNALVECKAKLEAEVD